MQYIIHTRYLFTYILDESILKFKIKQSNFTIPLVANFYVIIYQFCLQVFIYSLQKLLCVKIIYSMFYVWFDGNSKILGHLSAFYSFYTYLFKRLTKVNQILVVVKLASKLQASCPCKNGSYGISRCWLSFLMLSKMPCYGAMSSFCFHCFSIGCYQS